MYTCILIGVVVQQASMDYNSECHIYFNVHNISTSNDLQSSMIILIDHVTIACDKTHVVSSPEYFLVSCYRTAISSQYVITQYLKQNNCE